LGSKDESNDLPQKKTIKLKGNSIKIIIPLDRREGKPWSEPQEEEINARKFYQVIQGDKDNLESNAKGKLLHGSPLSVGQNSDIELYEWQMDNYEVKSKRMLDG
jgi:hypothetical protein